MCEPVAVHVVFRPTADGLAAASLEALRLRGQLGRLRGAGVLLVLGGPLGLVLGQWLFTLYAVVMGAALLSVLTRRTMRRVSARIPALSFDTTMEATDEGVTVTLPMAASRVAWSYYSGWAVIPEGLLLMHALSRRLVSFVPEASLTPEVLDLVARHVPRHPRARGELTAARP